MTDTAGRTSVRPKIMAYLTEHVGDVVHTDTMMSDLGLTRGQVQQGMLFFEHKGLAEVLVRGNAWRYRPEADKPVDLGELATVTAIAGGPIEAGQAVQYAPASDDLFEVVKVLKDGRLLLQDTEGALFVAKRLDA